MTVDQLREQLRTLPGDAEVVLPANESGIFVGATFDLVPAVKVAVQVPDELGRLRKVHYLRGKWDNTELQSDEEWTKVLVVNS